MLRNIMLNDHIGPPAKPVVKKGQKIKRGDLLANPEGLGAKVHSSFTGEIKEINENYIVIKADDNQTKEYVKISKDKDKLKMIENAGIIGAGGAGFPSHIKFDADIKGGCVIVNAAECEPVLSHNIEVLNKTPEMVIKGLQEIIELTNAKKGIIAIKPKHKDTLIKLGKKTKDIENIEIEYLPNMYPAGDERVVVREILDVELEPGQLPLEANAIVSNVETIKNVYLAIHKQKPVIDKDVTIGGRVKDSQDGKVFLDVAIGITADELINKSGGFIKPYGEIVIGGPFTGSSGDKKSPVGKKTGGFIVAMPYPQEKRKVGILECECGGQNERLTEIANKMGAEVVAKEKCDRMVEVNGRFRCELPGECPGQTSTVLSLRKKGAQVIIAGACED